MFKHILVPLDGSRLAESALPAASFLAGIFQARITLIHLIEQRAPAAVHGQAHLREAREAEAYLETVATRAFPSGFKVDCHVHDVAVRTVAEGIVAHATELDHDLIVMCSHGQGGAFRLFMGSIAQRIVSMDSLPVLIIHPDEAGEAPAFACDSLLVPLDGIHDHVLALEVATKIARACQSSLLLAIVVHRFETLRGSRTMTSRLLPGTTSQFLEMAADEAADYLKNLENDLLRESLPVQTRVLRGDPAATIIETAYETPVSLIVLATHGRTGTDAFWSESVAHQICSSCRLPLLLIPLSSR